MKVFFKKVRGKTSKISKRGALNIREKKRI